MTFSASLLNWWRRAATRCLANLPPITCQRKWTSKDAPILRLSRSPDSLTNVQLLPLSVSKLIKPDADIEIRSARLIIFDASVGDEEMKKIAHYCINAVESRQKDLSILAAPERAAAKPVPVLEGFREITAEQAPAWCKEKGLAMNGGDLMEVVKYFTAEGRDPNETEPSYP